MIGSPNGHVKRFDRDADPGREELLLTTMSDAAYRPADTASNGDGPRGVPPGLNEAFGGRPLPCRTQTRVARGHRPRAISKGLEVDGSAAFVGTPASMTGPDEKMSNPGEERMAPPRQGCLSSSNREEQPMTRGSMRSRWALIPAVALVLSACSSAATSSAPSAAPAGGGAAGASPSSAAASCKSGTTQIEV